jgi:hypothetical protein
MIINLTTTTKHNYRVNLIDIRNKLTIQEEVVEYMITRLFNKLSVYSLLDILFNDMKDDAGIFENNS